MDKLKVLIPTDFSVQGEYAFVLMQRLAEKMPMEIHFLHVLDFPDTVTIDALGGISTCGEIDRTYVEQQYGIVVRKLEQLRAVYADSAVHVAIGKPSKSITQFAEQHQFDLIAMGTKGSSGLSEKLFGSGTQHVARRSKVPVLSLMCDRSELQLNHLLLVHNFMDDQQQDLSLMKRFVSVFQPKVHLLQVLTSSSVNEERIVQSMNSFAERHGLIDVELHTVKDHDVEQGVVHFNQMHDMDLVCIGTHGKGSLFHSSATEKLINHMFKPIISFQLN